MTNRVIISRTDSIGDVMLTLPMLGILKHIKPNCEIIFLGRGYTKPILECCKWVDEIIDWDELSKLSKKEQVESIKRVNANAIIHVFPKKEIAFLANKANIKHRVGTARRWYNLLTCNDLSNFTRKGSALHESQLNIKLLKSFGYTQAPTLNGVSSYYGFEPKLKLPDRFSHLLESKKLNIILHPKSKGSAVEWGIDNFVKLTEILPQEKVKVFITGTKEEAMFFEGQFNPKLVTDITGQLTLSELISFISKANGLVAASTGPLHIAAALGIKAVGLYSTRKPIHPGRWAPVGDEAVALIKTENCPNCSVKKECNCIQQISPEKVRDALLV